MDAAEAHQQLSRATGAQPYAPPLEVPVPLEPATGQAVDQGHAALVEPERLAAGPGIEPANQVASHLGAALDGLQRLVDPINTFTSSVRDLLEVLDQLVDQDGREVWLTSGEVELDQWTQHVLDARDAVRRQLGSAS